MRLPQSQLTELRQVLQRSTEIRMRAIQEKIAIAFTFCATVDLEIRFGDPDRSRSLLNKLHSVVDGLIAHINDPAHVSGKIFKQEFRRQLGQLRQRVSLLRSQVEDVRPGHRHN